MPDLREVAALLDARLADRDVEERVLVYGSSLHDASDLDLLVRPAAGAALEALLPAAGFAPWHGAWMRIDGTLTAVVDLRRADGFGLPGPELARLYDDARPLPGLTRLAQPAPADALLVLARQLVGTDGSIRPKRLARGRAALELDPDALTTARSRAAQWGCAGALEVLACRLEGRPLPAGGAAALLARDGAAAPRWRRLAGRVRPRRRARGALIAMSGLDGAGKTTQTASLVAALDSLGYETVVLWDRISYDRVLHQLAAPAKLAVRLLRSRRPAGRPVTAAPVSTAAEPPPPPVERSSPVRWSWSLVVTLVHVMTAGPRTLRHVRRGRVVVRDRYVLDSVVHLRYHYGLETPVGPHVRLLQRLLPRPTAAYYLDLSAEDAHRRKPEQYDVRQLARQRALYREHAPALGVTVLDATAPPGAISEPVVREVLDTMVRRGVPRS